MHYVIAGTFTKDLLPQGGYTLGGTVFYGGVQAQRLGVQVSIISTAEPDIDLSPLGGTIPCYIQPSAQSTTFTNVYDAQGTRTQYLSAKADPLRWESAPLLTPAPDILHLGPLADEVPLDYGRAYPSAKIAVTPQGWMRQVDAEGRVRPKIWTEAECLLPQAWACVFSEEDVAYDEDEIRRLAALCPITVCTRNFSAASLFVAGQRSEVPVHPSTIVDPTGAGDVFAAAFFVWLGETDDPLAAVRFAHIAAGVSIGGRGVERVLTRAEVLAIYQASDFAPR
jgi:sugar/nucleoside kinase (ribokinase family)